MAIVPIDETIAVCMIDFGLLPDNLVAPILLISSRALDGTSIVAAPWILK